MKLDPTRFFGFTGLVDLTARYSQLQEGWVLVEKPPLSFWDRAQQELAIRISCVVGAYFAIPCFALLGAACQAWLFTYTAWTGVLLPVLRNTRSNSSNESRFAQPLEQCSEHLLRLSLNICMYFFRRSTALAFLFPSSILLLHQKIEGLPLFPGEEENPHAYIHVFARLSAALILSKPPSESDTADAKTVFTPVTQGWNLLSQITLQPRLGERISTVASFLFGEQPGQNTPPAPGPVGTGPVEPPLTRDLR